MYEEFDDDDYSAGYGCNKGGSKSRSSKMRSHLRQRQEARDQLVATIRRYGVYGVAALVFLPPQMVGLLALGAVIVYMLMKTKIWRGFAGDPMMAG
jgi:hypothetical protein